MRRLIPVFSIFLLSFPAPAWNATGHEIIAAIAYQRLTPAARARADDLLRQHPDYERILTRGAPADPAARARFAFLAAAVWPDTIKGDSRFYDDTRDDATPTPLLAGFPDMKRHTNWHYFDTPYAPDGAPTEKQLPPNALTELPRLIHELGAAPAAEMIYDLPWLEHIAGDVHQPLHSISRFLRGETGGDAGGNRVFVTPGRDLHAFWDSSAGTDTSDAYISKYAADAVAQHPAPHHIEKDPRKWIQESAALAIAEVYTFGNVAGSSGHPIQLSDWYIANAHRLAQAQVASAGYRLAEVLNHRLR